MMTRDHCQLAAPNVRKDASTHSITDMKTPPDKERQLSRLEYRTRGSRPSRLHVCHCFPSACPPACLFGPRVPAILQSHSPLPPSSFLFRQNETSEAGGVSQGKLDTYTWLESKYFGLVGWKVTRLDRWPRGGSREGNKRNGPSAASAGASRQHLVISHHTRVCAGREGRNPPGGGGRAGLGRCACPVRPSRIFLAPAASFPSTDG